MEKPTYYKVLWHNCNRCRTHYTSDAPHIRAYLCDDCWSAIPHFTVKAKPVIKQKKVKGYSWKEIALYTIGNLLCLTVIGYYLWFN